MQATNASRPDHHLANSLKCQAVNRITQFVSEYEVWLSDTYRRVLLSAAWGTPDDSELISALRPWIDELRGLGDEGILRYIPPVHAGKLHHLLNRGLDILEMRYRSCGPSPAEMMLALSPIDDILVFLALAAKTDEEIFVGRGY